MPLEPSELILNADGSVYHLNLLPEELAPTVLLVGDPERVPLVSRHFDRVELKKSKREFTTHTGVYNGLRLSVVSTGIGTDNMDIVLNELDALVNMDFSARTPRARLRSLNLIRLGTSGSIQRDVPVDALVISDYAIGFDGLLHFYRGEHLQRADIQLRFVDECNWSVMKSVPYVVAADLPLCERLDSGLVIRGVTATCPGFYAPQGRSVRIASGDPRFIQKLAGFEFDDLRITNLEMETAGLFGLAGVLGHAAASVSCILANRIDGTFSANPEATIDRMIRYALEKLT